ncbi:unnamed protein product [Amoebophrya sp. A25]|nr:unnamed protein product [Amoebophrya sp. A25]|eukprot:GSA25T00006013001.1
MQKLGEFVMSKLDKDGDGKITVHEVEEMVEETSEKLKKGVEPIRSLLQRYRWTAEMGVGYIACFYGGNFSHCFLCATAFQSAEGEEVMRNINELRKITSESTMKFVSHIGGEDGAIVVSSTGTNSNEHSPTDSGSERKVEIPSTTLLAAISSIDPERILRCMRSIYVGFLASLCAAVNENAAKFGLGLTLGDRITSFIMSVVERFMDQAETRISGAVEDGDARDSHVSTVSKAEDEKALVQKQSIQTTLAWTRLGVRAVASSLGVYVSWKLKDMAATWSTCHWGGITCIGAFCHLVGHKDAAMEEMLGFGLAGLGFAFHLRSFSKPAVPTLLSPLLMPVTLAETVLRSMTLTSS